MTEAKRIIVFGPRDWEDRDQVEQLLSRLYAEFGPHVVFVHGDCPTGVERFGRGWCELNGIAHEPHPYKRELGRRGGPVRNEEMAAAGAVLAQGFWDGNQRRDRNRVPHSGTLDMQCVALRYEIPVRMEPKRRRK